MAKQRWQGAGDVRRLMPEMNCDNQERRDWTKLPLDLTAEIAGRLLRFDVTEYIRFRAVCKPWRQSTDDPRGLHSRFLPRNWVVLSNHGEETRRRLLNVVTGASIVHVDLPELSGHHSLGYAEGLLVLWNTTTSAIRLLNPLTRAVTDLPDFSSIFANASKAAQDSAYQFRGFGFIDGGAEEAASPPTVVLCLDGEVPMLACIRPAEPRWALVDTSELASGAAKVSFRSVLSLRGRFYVLASTGDVMAVELHPEPRLVHVIRRQTAPTATTMLPAMCSFFLAPSASGDDDHDAGMVMVRDGRDGRAVEVLEMDVDGQKLVPTSTVGADRTVFVGSARALSVSTRLFPSIAANAVYFCTGAKTMELLFYIFYLDNGRGEPAHGLEFAGNGEAPFLGPYNLDVYLACCVDLVHVAM